MVYEVHWAEQGSRLYERSSFYSWGRYANGDLSGVALAARAWPQAWYLECF